MGAAPMECNYVNGGGKPARKARSWYLRYHARAPTAEPLSLLWRRRPQGQAGKRPALRRLELPHSKTKASAKEIAKLQKDEINFEDSPAEAAENTLAATAEIPPAEAAESSPAAAAKIPRAEAAESTPAAAAKISPAEAAENTPAAAAEIPSAEAAEKTADTATGMRLMELSKQAVDPGATHNLWVRNLPRDYSCLWSSRAEQLPVRSPCAFGQEGRHEESRDRLPAVKRHHYQEQVSAPAH
eukprot:238249-Chlamydomonas_euryale.AAC.1